MPGTRTKTRYILPIVNHNITGGICNDFEGWKAGRLGVNWRRKGLYKIWKRDPDPGTTTVLPPQLDISGK